MTVDLQRANLGQSTVQSEGALRDELEDRLRQAVIFDAAMNAAGDVPQYLARLLHRQQDVEFEQFGAQPNMSPSR